MWCKVGKTPILWDSREAGGRDIMFRGVQYINLDAKGRMAVPARQRESVIGDLSEGHMVMTVDTQSPCLALYPLPEWERIERDVQALPGTKPRCQSVFSDWFWAMPAISSWMAMGAYWFPLR